MLRRILLLSFLIGSWSVQLVAQNGPKVESIRFDQLEQRFRSGNDTLYIVNFWATWCKPCVAELPYLEEFHTRHMNDKVKVLLVSVDFQRQVESKLKPFITQRQLKPEVVHLNELKANEWIDRVNPEWSGAIPATVARKGKAEIFHEGSFEDMKALENYVKPLR